VRIADVDAPLVATPTIRLEVETSPSLAPRTAARSHPARPVACPNPQSFTHAVLDQIVRGLADAGHSYEVLDLYAIGFNPVFSLHGSTQFIHHTLPEGTLDRDTLERILIGGAGNPLKRLMAKRWVKDKSIADIVELFESNQPADVRAHQAKVARAQGLIFVASVFWMGFPAILKGWLERVFAYGFAYTLTAEG
jgi:NAD(P)H dehydrogenase (quinone)